MTQTCFLTHTNSDTQNGGFSLAVLGLSGWKPSFCAHHTATQSREDGTQIIILSTVQLDEVGERIHAAKCSNHTQTRTDSAKCSNHTQTRTDSAKCSNHTQTRIVSAKCSNHTQTTTDSAKCSNHTQTRIDSAKCSNHTQTRIESAKCSDHIKTKIKNKINLDRLGEMHRLHTDYETRRNPQITHRLR